MACEMMLKRKREEEFSRGVHKKRRRKRGAHSGKIVADAEGVIIKRRDVLGSTDTEGEDEERWYCIIGRTCYRY